ncbi:MAG: glycine betaine ABC transporter substrate-binding protein [Bryobacteraceae bacterium]
MDRKTFLACLMGGALLLAGCKRKRLVTIGSKNFTEQVVLGEIIAQHLEHRLHQRVTRQLNLGGTMLTQQALLNRDIDLYPEYTGTALMAILKDPEETDPGAVFDRVRSEYQRKMHLDWLDPLGINNTFVLVVRGEDARRHHLETLSDATALQSFWTLGMGYEFLTRADGYTALMRGYNLQWIDGPKTMDLGLLYKGLSQGQVNMIAANATDGLLSAGDFKILKDDKGVFPPYQACIVVREDSLAKTAGLGAALRELSGKFTNESMQALNYQVDGRHRPVPQVAAEFLRQAGLQ